MVLGAMNMPAQSFIFHGEDEIKFLATINFDVDSADVGSEWFNDAMFRRLIKLNIQQSHMQYFRINAYYDFVESSCWEK